jgi:hypothetical protein
MGEEVNVRQCGRVVKAVASKATGVTRAGSNPAVVVFYSIKLYLTLSLLIILL